MTDFRQIIDGTPVARRQRLILDEPGSVSSLSALIVRAEAANRYPSALLDEALRHSWNAVANHIGSVDVPIALSRSPRDSSVFMIPDRALYVGDLDAPVTPAWELIVTAGASGKSFRVLIYAESGESVVTPASL